MIKGIRKIRNSREVALALVTCVILSCVGCGDSQVAGSESAEGSPQASEGANASSKGDASEDVSDSDAESESGENLPGYLEACAAVAGTENLSELHADFLSEGNYDAVLLFGENLLFVRMYMDEDALAEDGADGYDYSENFCYSFALYSPEENVVLATYDSKEDPIDYYQVAGDCLLLIDYADYEIRIYDETLSPVGTFDAADFLDESDGTFYASAVEDVYYFMSYSDYSVKQVSFADGTAVVQDCDTGFYCSYIAGVSASGSKLVLQTVNAETFFNELLVVNAADLSVEKTFARTSAYCPTVSDSAFLAELDYENGLYVYENFAGESMYFTLADTLTALMLGEYIVTVQDALYGTYDETDEYDDAGSANDDAGSGNDAGDANGSSTDGGSVVTASDTYYTLCAYNGSGTCVSGCSYVSTGNIFSLSDPVYLEQYDCCVVLMKDYGDYEDDETDTFLLVWDMTEKGGIPDETRGDVPEYLMMCKTQEVALEVKESAQSSSGGNGADGDDTESGSGDNSTEGSDAESSSENGGDGSNDGEEGSTGGSEDAFDGYIYGDTVTLVTDPESYDWGDLADARQKADALAEQYGIEIYLGPEIPAYISEYQTEQCLDAETVLAALEQLETILALYPESLYPQLLYGDLQGIRIYLTGSIWGQGDYLVSQATAFVDDINDYAVLVADAWQYWDWNYTVNHEISHLIDRSLEFRSTYRRESLYSEDTWCAYNPDGFEYAGTYEDYYSLPWYDYTEYFLDEYGMTFATEDRAQLFGAAVSNYIDSDTYSWVFTEDSPVVQKLVYYCACIREDFDSEGWDAVLPWEEAVASYLN